MKTIEYELKTLHYKQQLLAILIFSLVCVGLWVIVSVARSQQTTKIDPELQRLARPLNPNINESVLQQLEQKRQFTENELRTFPIYRIVEADQNTVTSPQPIQIGSALGSELLAPTDASPPASALENPSTPSAEPASSIGPVTSSPAPSDI